MSLTSGLYLAYAGIRSTEQSISVTTQNITNANRPGYTRRTYIPDGVTTNIGTIPRNGDIYSALDKNLIRNLYEDSMVHNRNQVISENLEVYVGRLGQLGADTSLSGGLNNLVSNLNLLAASPENPSQKQQIVADAAIVADSLRQTSAYIQDARLQADRDIGLVIDDINELLISLDELNKRLVKTNIVDQGTLAELEDQRAGKLEELSALIDFNTFVDGQNRVNIYQKGGQPLLTARPYLLDYSTSSNFDSASVYPATIGPITVNGQDITTSIRGGELSGLIEIRDGTLVEEQEKLNEIASVLQDTLNAVLNQGASRPSRPSITSDPTVTYTGAEAFAGAGNFRIATTDVNGVVTNVTDINIAAFATVNDVVAAINGAAGVTASINAAGQIEILATTAGEGISFNELTSSVAPAGQGLSDYFGFNDMFYGSTAENIRVSQYLIDSPNYLALGRLSADPALAIGDLGITAGDTDIVESLANALNTQTSFNAAGNFAAKTSSITRYAESIISDAAIKASVALDDTEVSQAVYDQTFDFIKNQFGVNIDEETARLLELENYFQASATVIATLRDLFQDLIAAVR